MSIRTLGKIAQLASFGDGPFRKIEIFFVALSRLVRAKLRLPLSERDLYMRFNGVPCVIHISTKQDDLWVLNEVLVEEEYAITEVDDPRVIVDAGGNIGLSAIYFATRFPSATIYTIEADPVTFVQLQRNVAPFRNIVPIQAALASRDGSDITFYHSNDRPVSSSLIRRSPTDTEVRVRSVSIDGVMRTYGIETIDICKFDIEGAEDEVFAVDDLEKKVYFCIGEVHVGLMKASREDFLQLFSRFDVTILELSRDKFIMRASSPHLHSRA